MKPSFCRPTRSAVIALALVSAASAQPFVHPGILQTRQDLGFMRSKVAAGEQPWKQAWDNLLAEPYSSLRFQATPSAHIERGAYGSNSSGAAELAASANAAYSQALQWFITGDSAHARKAIEILDAWSPVLWDFEGNDAKLLAGWTGGALCAAAEILRSGESGWSAQGIEQFKRMMLTVYYSLLKDFFPQANGNWDAAIIDSLLSIGIFTDNRAIFQSAVDHFLHGDGNGGITKYVYPSGQCDENMRDQGHAQLGLGYFARAARVAEVQGVDLWSTAASRLALGFEYTARFMAGEHVPAYGGLSTKGRDRYSDIYEPVYQHYRNEKGIELPFVTRAIEQTRPTGWTALIYYHGPAVTESKGGLRPNIQAPSAGAQSGPTAEAPASAVVVTPGQSIQSALDAAVPGGWITLTKGVHTIPAPLRLPSGVTVAGMGRDSILFLDPKAPAGNVGLAIVNGVTDLHDVTLRDFVIEGSVRTVTATDPNSDRRVRSYQNAPNRGGISFAAEHAGQMKNIRLEHLTVRNCTHNGVAIRGAEHVEIISSDFSGNGSSVVPGPGLEHNLLLTHAANVLIRDSRLDASLWGSGLDIATSHDITVSGSELARNARWGVYTTESRSVRVLNSLAEGNDTGGIAFDSLMEGCRDLEIRNNVVRNNAGPGIATGGATGIVDKNDLADNGR
ncbi:MAG TPA: alginate lyase family protein [Bryobacteraceae bacterium]|nr:alginate lyase family protein [Bryobacteraceae bacterium]